MQNQKLKLMIQIPCFNEAGTLGQVLDELPKELPGIDSIDVLIINDGSTDSTIEVAKAHGVKHFVHFPGNRWLGTAFRLGVAYSLSHGADIVVNTDADNQYPSEYIKDLIKPIVEGKADIVIGDRRPAKVAHFKRYKKIFQKLGNVVMTFFTGIAIPDAVSGFRAYSKESLEILNVTVRFSYVIDTILQAYKKWLHIARVPIHTNLPTRPSRLFKNIWVHMKKSATSIVRVYTMYEPFKIFFGASIPFLIIGLWFVFRFMYFYFFTDLGAGKIQSLTIGGILTTIGCTFLSVGIIWDVVARNRILIEENLRLTKKLLYKDETP
jgi:glycosyltransferase involved in cell wall biosynthesis